MQNTLLGSLQYLKSQFSKNNVVIAKNALLPIKDFKEAKLIWSMFDQKFDQKS